ncbi:hypothetical protein QF031_003141 [Pseudarthrobacter defluvii]|uniref:hypothetical protein n=1 Tax=Pseudarthrobacter defluvii TaxID=410837 RepID=UPI0027853B71|nr:hypothetical protein [Pseudarthrobacter defluvii]MDQ0770392.1 hypothetical protein [Pseudarthrobacter defluvii]
MTGDDNPRQERRLDDERAVGELLEEAGLAGDPVLRHVLLQVRELRVSAVPVPSSKLAALLADPDTARGIRLEAGKPLKKTRAVFTVLAVAALFRVAGGSAGNEGIRRAAEGSISAVMEWFAPQAPAAPLPAPPPEAEAPNPAPAVVPVHGEWLAGNNKG